MSVSTYMHNDPVMTGSGGNKRSISGGDEKAMTDMVVKQEQATTLSNVQPCVELSSQVLLPEPPRDERLQPESPSGGPIQQKDPTETLASDSISRIDQTSAKGLFGWTTIDDVNIPYLLRFEKKYVSVRMVEMKLLSRFPSSYPGDLQNRPPVVSHYLTPAEAKLLNEINLEHCAGEYGLETFTTEDLTVSHHDFEEFYNAVKKEFPTTDRQKAAECSKVDGGWLQINNTVIPYVTRREMPYVPLSVVMYAAGFLTNVQIEGETPSEDECKFLNYCCSDEGLNFSFARKSKLVSLELVHKTSKEKVTITKLSKTNPFSYAQYRDEIPPVTHDSAKLCNAELVNTRTNSQPNVTHSGHETGNNTQAQPRNPQHEQVLCGIRQLIKSQHSISQQSNRQACKPQCEVSSTRGNLTGISILDSSATTPSPGFGQMPYPNSAAFHAAIVNRIPTTAPPSWKETNKDGYDAAYSLPHHPFYANARGMQQSSTQRPPPRRLSNLPSASPPSLIPISELAHNVTSIAGQRLLPNVCEQSNPAQNPGYSVNIQNNNNRVQPNNTSTVVSPIATNVSGPSQPTTIPRSMQAAQLNSSHHPDSDNFAQWIQGGSAAAFKHLYPNQHKHQHPNQHPNQQAALRLPNQHRNPNQQNQYPKYLNQQPNPNTNRQPSQHPNQYPKYLNQQPNPNTNQQPSQHPNQYRKYPNQHPNQHSTKQAVLRSPLTQNMPSHSQCNNGRPFPPGHMVVSSHIPENEQLAANTNLQQNAGYCNFPPNSSRRVTPPPGTNINPPELVYPRPPFAVQSNIGMVGALAHTSISPDLNTPTNTNIRVDPNAAGNLSGLHPPGRPHGGSMQEPHRNISGQNGNMSVSRTMADRTLCTAAPVVTGTSIAQVPSLGIPDVQANANPICNPVVTTPQVQGQPRQPLNNPNYPNYQNCPPNSAPQRTLGNSTPQRMLENRTIAEPAAACPILISDRTVGKPHMSERSDEASGMANWDVWVSSLISGSQSSPHETISTTIDGTAFNSSDFLGRPISYIVKSGKRFALLENMASTFFHYCQLDEFQHAVNSVLKIPLTDLTEQEENAFITFYRLPTIALKCKKVVDLDIFKKFYTHLVYMFSEKYKNGSRKNREPSKMEDCQESSRSQRTARLGVNHNDLNVPIKQEPDAATLHTGVKRCHPDTSISPPAKRTMHPLECLQVKVARYSPTGSLPPSPKPSQSNSLHSPVLMTTESTGLENTSVLVSHGKVIPSIADKHASVASTNIVAMTSLPNIQRRDPIDKSPETGEQTPDNVAGPDSHNVELMSVPSGTSESNNRLSSDSRENDKEPSSLDKTKSHLVSERLERDNSGNPVSSPTCQLSCWNTTTGSVDDSTAVLPVAPPVEVAPIVGPTLDDVTKESAAQPLELPEAHPVYDVPVELEDDITVHLAHPVDIVPTAQPVKVVPVVQSAVEYDRNVSVAQPREVVPASQPQKVVPFQPDDDINLSIAQPVEVVPTAQPMEMVPTAQPMEMVPWAEPMDVMTVLQQVEQPLSPSMDERVDNSDVIRESQQEPVSTLSNDEEASQLPLLITNVHGREEDSDSFIMDLTSSPGPNNDEDSDVVQLSEEPEGRSVSRRRKRGYRQVMGMITAKPSMTVEDDDDADCVIVSAVGKIICIE